MKQDIGDRFKRIEAEYRIELPKRSIIGLRLDGRSFHRFCRQFERPYDLRLMAAMDAAAMAIAKDFNALFAYTQSDEISVFLTDLQSDASMHMFDGRAEKPLTVSASLAGITVNNYLLDHGGLDPRRGLPVFDARVAFVGGLADLNEYLTWRRLDARTNAVTMAAQVLRSHKQLHQMSTRDRIDLLAGTEYERLPEEFMNGRMIIREVLPKEFIHPISGEPSTALRTEWKPVPATKDFTDGLLSGFNGLEQNTSPNSSQPPSETSENSA